MPQAGERKSITLLQGAIKAEYDIWQGVNSSQSDSSEARKSKD